jgi:two-component system, NarL family, sensor kinase
LRLSYAAIEDAPTGDVSVGVRQRVPVTVDLVVGEASLGRLSLETDESRDPFGPGDRRLLEDVGAQVGTLVQAVAMSSELQRSRQRLVMAQEEERRRLRRDLHDGLGPSLATIAMRLESTRDLVRDDPDEAAAAIDRLADLAREEIAEVRRLVDGLRPPALDQLGLVTALRQRAEEGTVTARSGRHRLHWRVEADGELDPLPAAVEVAAYRIVLEAVTNAIRHSNAENCIVRLRREDGTLVVVVRDDGTGLVAAPRLGVGLTSMRERAEELGGSCTVTSGEGAGTVVEARLPVDGSGSS